MIRTTIDTGFGASLLSRYAGALPAEVLPARLVFLQPAGELQQPAAPARYETQIETITNIARYTQENILVNLQLNFQFLNRMMIQNVRLYARTQGTPPPPAGRAPGGMQGNGPEPNGGLPAALGESIRRETAEFLREAGAPALIQRISSPPEAHPVGTEAAAGRRPSPPFAPSHQRQPSPPAVADGRSARAAAPPGRIEQIPRDAAGRPTAMGEAGRNTPKGDAVLVSPVGAAQEGLGSAAPRPITLTHPGADRGQPSGPVGPGRERTAPPLAAGRPQPVAPAQTAQALAAHGRTAASGEGTAIGTRPLETKASARASAAVPSTTGRVGKTAESRVSSAAPGTRGLLISQPDVAPVSGVMGEAPAGAPVQRPLPVADTTFLRPGVPGVASVFQRGAPAAPAASPAREVVRRSESAGRSAPPHTGLPHKQGGATVPAAPPATATVPAAAQDAAPPFTASAPMTVLHTRLPAISGRLASGAPGGGSAAHVYWSDAGLPLVLPRGGAADDALGVTGVSVPPREAAEPFGTAALSRARVQLRPPMSLTVRKTAPFASVRGGASSEPMQIRAGRAVPAELIHSGAEPALGTAPAPGIAPAAARSAQSPAGAIAAPVLPPAIVHRRQAERHEGGGAPPEQLDIQTIRRVVKEESRSERTTEHTEKNIAINAPQPLTAPAAEQKQTGQVPINQLADQVYHVLEKRLRSERLRRGGF